MVLHIGGDTIVTTQSIIAIIDIETVNISEEMRKYFRPIKMEFEKTSKEECKSFVITTHDYPGMRKNEKKTIKDRSKIYCSTISSSTLQKRCGMIKEKNIL